MNVIMQVLYVLSNIFIEPRVICHDLNFCKKSLINVKSMATSNVNPDITSALSKLKEHMSVKQEWDTSKESLSKLREKLQFMSTQLPQHTESHKHGGTLQRDELSQSATLRHSYNRTLKNKVAPKNGVIRFLQLSDIHADHQYDEVHTSYFIHIHT